MHPLYLIVHAVLLCVGVFFLIGKEGGSHTKPSTLESELHVLESENVFGRSPSVKEVSQKSGGVVALDIEPLVSDVAINEDSIRLFFEELHAESESAQEQYALTSDNNAEVQLSGYMPLEALEEMEFDVELHHQQDQNQISAINSLEPNLDVLNEGGDW